MIRKVELPAKPVSFIGAYALEDTSICDSLIAFFKGSPHLHTEGVVNTVEGTPRLNHAVKASVDLAIPPDSTAPEFVQYTQLLQHCIRAYIADYGFCDNYAPWSLIEQTNIQYYPPGGGYKVWHTERNNASGVVASRHLVFMTYLNTVREGGETMFYYQALGVKPVKGLSLIWPADWTHTHRGVPSPMEEKYIITGWLNYTA
jgi:hypothetical protein